MDTREETLLLNAAELKYPTPKEHISTVSELQNIIKKILTDHDFNPKDKKWSHLLIEATEHNHSEIVEALLEAKIDPNVQDEKRSALHLAAHYGHLDILKLLMAAKADINTQDGQYGTTALYGSVVGKNQDAMRLLLDAKADPNLGQDAWHKPLPNATRMKDRLDVIVPLMNAGAQITLEGSLSDFDHLIMHYNADLDGNIIEGMTREKIEKALPVIHFMLDKNAPLKHPLGLYHYLRVCNQKNPLVKDSFKKLCEYLEKSAGDQKEDDFNREHILIPARDYLKKLDVLMQYKPAHRQTFLMNPWEKEYDHAAYFPMLTNHLKAKEVEELYEGIRKKRHPWLYSFGLAPAVQPEPAEKRISQQRF